MATELNKFFQARRKFGIDMPEASALFGEQRALEFAGGKRPFTQGDEHEMESYCGRRELDKKAASEAAKAEYRRTWGS